MHGKIVAINAGYQLAFTRDLAVSVERVWRMLTDREARAKWLFDGTIEPCVGGVVDLFDSHHHVTGRVTAWDPPNLLALTWSSSDAPLGEVRFELTGIGPESCRLRVVHTAEGDTRPRSLAAGWHAMLDRLQQGLEGMPSDECPSFDDLVREYLDLPIEGGDES
jgi:uncharacterized protein YndB with AHSA1/START domain